MSSKSQKKGAFIGSEFYMLRGGEAATGIDHVLHVSEPALLLALDRVVDLLKLKLGNIQDVLHDGLLSWDAGVPGQENARIDPVELIGTWQFLHGISQAFQLPEPADIAVGIQLDLDCAREMGMEKRNQTH
jgi:hypothetical protein